MPFVRGSYYAYFRGQAKGGFQRFGNFQGHITIEAEASDSNPQALKSSRSVRPQYCSAKGTRQEEEEKLFSKPHLLARGPASRKSLLSLNKGNSLT